MMLKLTWDYPTRISCSLLMHHYHEFASTLCLLISSAGTRNTAKLSCIIFSYMLTMNHLCFQDCADCMCALCKREWKRPEESCRKRGEGNFNRQIMTLLSIPYEQTNWGTCLIKQFLQGLRSAVSETHFSLRRKKKKKKKKESRCSTFADAKMLCKLKVMQMQTPDARLWGKIIQD